MQASCTGLAWLKEHYYAGKEAVHYETTTEPWPAPIFYYPFASGGAVHVLIPFWNGR